MESDQPTYLTPKVVAKRFVISIRCLNRLVDQNRFPKPVKLGDIDRWRLAEIETWERAGCPPFGPPVQQTINGPLKKKVIDRLRQATSDTSISAPELASEIGENADSVRVTLHRLKRFGVIRKEGNGWVLVEKKMEAS